MSAAQCRRGAVLSAQINRLRWQSRRGTLEMDLILERFWRREDLHTDENLRALSELLALDDEELRRAISDESCGAGGEKGRGGNSAVRKMADILRRL